MEKRKRKSDGNPFWGCSKFPTCRATKPVAGGTKNKSQDSTKWEWKYQKEVNPQLPKCLDKLPKALSPTKAIEYLQCPRKYYESAISKRIIFQGSKANVIGNLVHHSLDKIFDLPPVQRNISVAETYIDQHWTTLRNLPENKTVSKLNDVQVNTMIKDAKEILKKWFQLEDPKTMTPRARELKVEATIKEAPMTGVIDRIDDQNLVIEGSPVRLLSEKGAKEHVKIVDYKTGKIPKPEYLGESLFQIYSYALAIESSYNVRVNAVQLLYVSHKHPIEEKLTDSIREETSLKFNEVWKGIKKGCETGKFPSIPQPLCNWCDAKSICPSWTS